MSENYQENSSELCSAGKLLESQLKLSTENLLKVSESLQKTCTEMNEKLGKLSEYMAGDVRRIEALEESKKCKSQQIKEAKEHVQKIEVSLATHLGEHHEMKRQEGNEGRKWGILSGTGIAGIFEMIRQIIAKSGG